MIPLTDVKHAHEAAATLAVRFVILRQTETSLLLF